MSTDTDTDTKLITKSAGILKANGFSQRDSINDQVEDIKGITYTEFEREGQRYYVRAKEYVYQGLASFGEEMVTDARSDSADLIIYFDDLEQCFVFDPAYVDRHGDRATGQSKHSDSRNWVELPLDHGAALDDYLEGRVTPSRTAAATPGDDTINASLDQF